MSIVDFVIHDFDGTLFDTYPIIINILMNALEKSGVQTKYSYDYILRLMKINYKHTLNTITGDNLDILEKVKKNNLELKRKDKSIPDITDGLVEYMDFSKENNIRNFIISNNRQCKIVEILEYYNIDNFDDIVTPFNYGGFRKKPSAEMFKYLIDKHNLRSKKGLSVGDRMLDLKPSRNCRIPFIFMGYTNNEKENDVQNIEDYNDFMNIVLSPRRVMQRED